MKKKILKKKDFLLNENFNNDDHQLKQQKRKGNREYTMNERVGPNQGFSLDELHSLTSYAKKKAYCREHLTSLGTGSSRMVFDLDGKTVLKLAINKKGLAQNDVEWDMRNELSFTAEIFDIDDDGYWIIMERAEKLTAKEFKNLQGYSLEELSAYVDLMLYRYSNGRKGMRRSLPEEFVEKMHEDEFAGEIIDAEMSYSMKAVDLVVRQNLGIVTHDGERRVVIIDLGYNDDVKKAHYSESVINEQLIVEKIKNSFNNNLPCSEVFFNDMDPDMVIDHDKVDSFMTKGTYKNFPRMDVRTDLLVPTQVNLDSDKLPGLDVNPNTEAILIKKGELYYIVDGHHRLAKNILNNVTTVSAYVEEFKEPQSLNENFDNSKLEKKKMIITKGYEIACDDLGFGDDRPKLHLINDISYTTKHKSFAAYAPGTKEVYCVIANRNTADCMRSICHELMHHKQNLEGRLYAGAGEDGTDIENEANSYAGKIMRKLGRELENIFEDREKLTERISRKELLKKLIL